MRIHFKMNTLKINDYFKFIHRLIKSSGAIASLHTQHGSAN